MCVGRSLRDARLRESVKKSWAIYAVVLGGCLIVGVFALPFFTTRPLSKSELLHLAQRKASNEIVVKVEQFRKSSGHLPEGLSDIGVKGNESCPCYCKTSNDSFMVWYGTTLGESDTYDSRTKQWSAAAGLVCAK
jgi:hypothetical protein